jgi:hypothetical protein
MICPHGYCETSGAGYLSIMIRIVAGLGTKVDSQQRLRFAVLRGIKKRSRAHSGVLSPA